MSVTYMETTAASALGAVSGWLGGAAKAIRERSARRVTFERTLRELSAFSDRDLADLGMSRFDIRRIAREAAGMVG